jgi:hypothetical protein
MIFANVLDFYGAGKQQEKLFTEVAAAYIAV